MEQIRIRAIEIMNQTPQRITEQKGIAAPPVSQRVIPILNRSLRPSVAVQARYSDRSDHGMTDNTCRAFLQGLSFTSGSNSPNVCLRSCEKSALGFRPDIRRPGTHQPALLPLTPSLQRPG